MNTQVGVDEIEQEIVNPKIGDEERKKTFKHFFLNIATAKINHRCSPLVGKDDEFLENFLNKETLTQYYA